MNTSSNRFRPKALVRSLGDVSRVLEYHAATARTIEEASKLVAVGFEYVTEIDGVRLFRKRK